MSDYVREKAKNWITSGSGDRANVEELIASVIEWCAQETNGRHVMRCDCPRSACVAAVRIRALATPPPTPVTGGGPTVAACVKCGVASVLWFGLCERCGGREATPAVTAHAATFPSPTPVVGTGPSDDDAPVSLPRPSRSLFVDRGVLVIPDGTSNAVAFHGVMDALAEGQRFMVEDRRARPTPTTTRGPAKR